MDLTLYRRFPVERWQTPFPCSSPGGVVTWFLFYPLNLSSCLNWLFDEFNILGTCQAKGCYFLSRMLFRWKNMSVLWAVVPILANICLTCFPWLLAKDGDPFWLWEFRLWGLVGFFFWLRISSVAPVFQLEVSCSVILGSKVLSENWGKEEYLHRSLQDE